MKTIDIIKIKMVRESEMRYDPIEGPEDAYKIFTSLGLAEAAEEEFWMLALSTRGDVIGAHEVSHGELCSTAVHPREVFKRAILNNAAGIIVAHNHPSGDPAPSGEDKTTTERLTKAGDILGVKVVDHIIIGSSDRHYSFRDSGLL